MPDALIVAALVTALVAAGWAGFLVMAQQAPTLPQTLGDAPPDARGPMPADRALHISRLALLVLAGAAASEAVGWWREPWLPALRGIVLIIGFLYLVAEGLPRSFAVLVPRLPVGTAAAARRSLAVFAPLFGMVMWVESLMHRLFPTVGGPPERFGREHHDMLAGVFSLGETTVAEVMTPRLDIVAVEATASWKEVVEALRRSEHARMPVYSQDLDTIVGIVYGKDVTPAASGVSDVPARWQDLMRAASFVPESKSLTAQLRDFQRGRGGLAIVVDEFGGTSGLITLEDVLEEVVGEIHGEYDVDEKPAVEREGEDRFWVDGSLPLDDLSELLRTPIEREEVSTVGGLVYSELGRVPRPGEEFRMEPFRVVVEQVVRRRVRRVYFERVTASSAEVAEESGR